MESFRWTQEFETGLHTVDQQHHRLVDLINRIGALLAQDGEMAAPDVATVIAELVAYTHYHFTEEEALMVQAGLDPVYVRQHENMHKDFLREVQDLQQGDFGNSQASQGLLRFLTHWLAFHILGTDQGMARQIAAIRGGQTPQQAHASEHALQDASTAPLLHALHGLFQEVSERNRQLQALNASLEAKVAQRTESLLQANARLEQMASTDALTGLPNRRQALAALDQAWAAANASGSDLACMMIDADGFKQANDTYGHDAGDEVLRQLSRQLRYSVRSDDIVCRLGGDEFLIICPATGLTGALKVAATLREKVAQLTIPLGSSSWLGSVSVGVAAKTPDLRDAAELIKLADQGLYQSKRKGRNRVETVMH